MANTHSNMHAQGKQIAMHAKHGKYTKQYGCIRKASSDVCKTWQIHTAICMQNMANTYSNMYAQGKQVAIRGGE